jgi:hypothetical protein
MLYSLSFRPYSRFEFINGAAAAAAAAAKKPLKKFGFSSRKRRLQQQFRLLSPIFVNLSTKVQKCGQTNFIDKYKMLVGRNRE